MPEIEVSRGRALAAAGVLLVVLVLAGRYVLGAGAASSGREAAADVVAQPLRAEAAPPVVVHVVGAVRTPGLYRLGRGKRPAAVPGRGWAERWTLPSVFSSRGTSSASRPRASSASRRSPSSRSSQSGLSRIVTSWRARSTPASLAAPKPGLPSRRTTSAPAAAARAGEPSVEPESTTTTWGSWGPRCAAIEASSGGRSAADSCVTTTTVTLTVPPSAGRRAGRPRCAPT